MNFDPKIQDKKSKISRDPTPFPKELHSKAMQWRAAREIVVAGGEGGGGGGVAQGEGGVTIRPHSNKRVQNNRNSLLKALANPLDEVKG